MKWLSSSIVASLALSLTACIGASDEDLTQDPTEAIASKTQALGESCGIEPNMQAFCAATDVEPILGRNVYYRLGATTGPGYNPATGEHSAVFLFQGNSPDGDTLDNGTGGSSGPGATFGVPFTKPGRFAVWHQVATIVALVDSGYTVIQAAARLQPGGGYSWDTNKAQADGTGNAWEGSLDQALIHALIAAIQPSMTTFGLVDINHVYAMGISAGGYMSSRMAIDYAGGVNNDSTVKSPNLPVRAVAINSAAYQTCAGFSVPGIGFFNCSPMTLAVSLPANHAPVFFLHDSRDRTVPIGTRNAYRDRLGMVFPPATNPVNPAYTVNGVPQTFRSMDDFTGTVPLVFGHQWSEELSAGPDNKILLWFNSHR